MAQKKRTAYQKAIEHEEGSGGSGSSATTNRPKSREKKITGTGKPIVMGRRSPSRWPGWDEYKHKTATSQAQILTEDIKPSSRRSQTQPGTKKETESVKRLKKKGSGRKF